MKKFFAPIFGFLALSIFLLGPVAAVTSACGLLPGAADVAQTATRPAAFGVALAACEDKSEAGPGGWTTYVPCCEKAMRDYGHSPAECADGGAQ